MQRSVRGEVISSTCDEPAQRHVQVAARNTAEIVLYAVRNGMIR